MSKNITDNDYRLKSLFEDTLGFTITKASFNKGTLVYYMYSVADKKDITFECKPNTAMSCTIDGVCRHIPTRVELEAALGHKPSSMEICRIVQEVILKMLDDGIDETKRQVGRDFDRFSRRGH